MLKCVQLVDKNFKECSINDLNNWVILTSPSNEELVEVSKNFDIDMDLLISALDPEESSRIEKDDNELMIIINSSKRIISDDDEYDLYDVIPIGIVLLDNHIITVSNEEHPLIMKELSRRYTSMDPAKQSRFTLQLINLVAAKFLADLKRIDHMTSEIEKSVHNATNEEIKDLLAIEKTLVYFRVNLSANAKVLKKIDRLNILKKYEEDDDLIEDVIIELEQAIEMASINTEILRSIREAISSITNNNLNVIMKILALLTVIFSIPTLIYSFFGMNVELFLNHNKFAIFYISGFSVILCLICYYILKKKGFM